MDKIWKQVQRFATVSRERERETENEATQERDWAEVVPEAEIKK